MKRILHLFSIVVILVPILLNAGTTGKLTGTVTDAATGEALPFVNITIEGTNLGAATDLDGNYVILNIPPGKYNVKYQYIGYQAVVVEGVQISIDLTTTQDIELSSASVELGEIVVEGKETLRKDVTASQSLISAEDISNLPVAELNDILSLQAGVTTGADGSFHIRGGRTTEIAYWVNGVSITDAYDNSRGIEIDNSSVQELQVISGTFNAEYGQALSGIINTVTKEGGMSYHGNIKLYSSDYVSNFTEYFPHVDDLNPIANYNMQASLEGPVPFTNNNLRFFVTGRYVYDDGYLYGERKFNPDGSPGDGEVVPMDWSKRIMSQANISWNVSSAFKFNLEGLYSKEDYQNYNHGFRWNPDGDVTRYSEALNTTFTMTHTFSNYSFYTLRGSYFFKDFNEYLYDDPLDPRYMHPDSLNTVAYSFLTMGTNLHRFFRETNTFIGKFDFTSQIADRHMIKLGLEGRYHKLKFDDFNLEPLRIDGIPAEPFQAAIPDPSQPNRTKYDSNPIELSAYLQDKIEYDDVIINVGLRLDYFDSRGQVIVDPSDPNIYVPLRQEMQALSIKEREPYYYKDADPKWQLSPRLGIAYPISATGVLRFSYGHFLQIPSFQYLFQNGRFEVGETGSAYGPYGNPDLEAQKTIMYELGFKQEFMESFYVDITGFYRDIRNWITAGPLTLTRNSVSYSVYTNKDYSNVRGITIDFSKRFSRYYSIDFNYTYQVAEGTNSRPEEEFGNQLGDQEPRLYLIPLEWDQRHLANLNVYVGMEDWGVSLLARYGTGLPYTPSITQYTSDRGISSGLQTNSRRRPNQFSVDMRVHKIFNVFGYEMKLFANIFNLLDSKVVVNVFGDTGQPDYTTEAQNVGEDPNRPNTVDEYLKYPWHYGSPRLIQLGFEVSF
ncbi:MAG: TonB-dependent receptor [Melioribacteraceae bacterium]|nr:TonB-dependent receptor [Melioribacteraceae bacterium]MCF8356592.1 TonB-dependent receptor [Melioribacteraceae bacterium]MCF8395188.1 TonB-dependent receptor [Melioribacteraceae bacterium]MCF8420032.1 TonB-dependent receptor [Melioribacteraceae bacterium]